MKNFLIVAFVLLAAGVVFGVSTYNSLISLNEGVTAKWNQIDNQLQRRSDLIPNLVNTVKGYAAHENKAIDTVVQARANLAKASTPEEKAKADGLLSSALGNLFVIVENYPTLKADKAFVNLMDELAGTENRIAVARMDYNESVQAFNVKIRVFPSKIFADMLNFTQKQYFKVEENAKNPISVKF